MICFDWQCDMLSNLFWSGLIFDYCYTKYGNKKNPLQFDNFFVRFLTWCRAVSPSMLAVSISAPRFWSLSTSSLSEAAQAAKKTQPSVNWILCDFRFGSESWELVSLSDHLFNCSALLKRAEEFRFSNEVIIVESWETFRSQQFDEIYLKSFLFSKRLATGVSSENVLILGTIQKRRTKVKCVCVLLYSSQQLEAANFLLKKRNGLERGVPQILRHLFTNKFVLLFFVSLCHRVSLQGLESLWGDCMFIPADWGS